MHKKGMRRGTNSMLPNSVLPAKSGCEGDKMAKCRRILCKTHKTCGEYSLKIVMKNFEKLLQFESGCCIMIGLDMR